MKAPLPAPPEEPPKKKKLRPLRGPTATQKKGRAHAKKAAHTRTRGKSAGQGVYFGLFKPRAGPLPHIVRKHKDARNPTSWRHPGRRIDRTRQDATDGVEKMRTVAAGFFILCVLSRVASMAYTWARPWAPRPIIQGSEAPQWGSAVSCGRTRGH